MYDRSKGPRVESLETCFLFVFGHFSVPQKCRGNLTLLSSGRKEKRLSFPESELFIAILIDATLFVSSVLEPLV